jgi:hypothetical protein
MSAEKLWRMSGITTCPTSKTYTGTTTEDINIAHASAAANTLSRQFHSSRLLRMLSADEPQKTDQSNCRSVRH